MARFVYADADRPSFRTQESRRLKDIDFLAKLRAANESELDRMTWDFRDAPEWMRVAIACAIKRVVRIEGGMRHGS